MLLTKEKMQEIARIIKENVDFDALKKRVVDIKKKINKKK
jgi:hypothetical protein